MKKMKMVTILIVLIALALSVQTASARDNNQGTVMDDLVQGIRSSLKRKL